MSRVLLFESMIRSKIKFIKNMQIKSNKYLDNKSADYGFRLLTTIGGAQ